MENSKQAKAGKVFYRRVRCQYCNAISKVVQGGVLYGAGHKLSHKEFYYCEPCEAWVGMHDINKKPFGTLAKSDLRKKRVLAHAEFDKVWKAKILEGYSKTAARQEAYEWLSKSLDIPINQCHIGFFNVGECNKTIAVCKAKKA